jgi:hypothetical protein
LEDGYSRTTARLGYGSGPQCACSIYLADVSVPLLGTSFVESPQISGGRSIVHFVLFLLCFHFGFVRKPKA